MMTFIAIMLFVINAGSTGVGVTSVEIAKAFSTLADCQSFAASAMAAYSVSQFDTSGSVVTGAANGLKVVCIASQGL